MTQAPIPEAIDRDTPLRLDVAARMRFPDGSIKGKALRREAEKGNLTIFRIAGKDYTTLAALDEMIRRCRVDPTEAISTTGPRPAAPHSPSEMERRRAAQASLMTKLAHEKEQRKRSLEALRNAKSANSTH